MRNPHFVRKDWNIWSPRQHPLPARPKIMWRISICTVCMGRTHDLRQTLIKNIKDNEDYPNVEFVVLNYNSRDDMHDFMQSKEVATFLKNGRVRYMVTREPQFYQSSHSRNIAFRNSTGHIVTNVDADNFTGVGFASYLSRLANVCPRRALFVRRKWRIHGRIGMFRDEFDHYGGYDEDLSGYGWEDYSLMGRVLRAGHTLMWWLGSDVDFSRRIITPKNRVAENMHHKNWREAESRNMNITLEKIERRDLIVNRGKEWGFSKDLEICT